MNVSRKEIKEIEEFAQWHFKVPREMTEVEIKRFLKDRRIGVLATIRPDDTPQVRPIWYYYDNRVIRMWASMNTVKLKNIRRDSRVSFLVHDEVWPYKGVTVRGRVEISHTGRKAVLPVAKKMGRHYRGEAGARYVDLVSDDSFVILTLRPEKFGSWDNTKVPPYSRRKAEYRALSSLTRTVS